MTLVYAGGGPGAIVRDDAARAPSNLPLIGHTCGDDVRHTCAACKAEWQARAQPSDLALLQDVGPDYQLVKMWLHGRSKHTQRAYITDIRRFFAFVRKMLSEVALQDLQLYSDHLRSLDLVDGTRHRAMAAVKSLFAFGARLRYLPFDVAAVVKMPAGKETLNERILEEVEVSRLIAGETDPRNRLMLELLYVAGVRVGELVGLTWRDVQAHRGAGQITVFGKGRKTRAVRLEAPTWTALEMTRGSAGLDAPVFVSRRRGHLHPEQVRRIVRRAALRVGITKPVTSHWLRHCHASHSLDGGAPMSLVQATLGHANIATTSKYLHARPNESSSRFIRPIPR